MYCVRFNSKEHIEKNKVEVGMTVYCAPKTPYTTYVFLAQLRRLKGSDASWLNDIEPPVEEVEYSDDEMERIAKKKKRNRKFQNACVTEEDAIPKEGEDLHRTGTGFRGRKRQYNHNGNHQNFSNNQTPAVVSHPPGCPPFMPPMVPGFSPYPYAPPHAFAGPPNQGQWFPGPNHMNRHRGFPGPRGPRGPPRFRPPNYGPPQESYANTFQPNSYGPNPDAGNWGSWNPPPQWQANMSNFNFGGAPHNPYAQMHQMPRYANPSPQPPPPPPPPPPGQ